MRTLVTSMPLALALATGCGGNPPPAPSSAPAAEAPQANPIRLDSLRVPNLKRPAPGLLSGGQPDAAGLTNALDVGVKTVINLRPLDEPGAWEEQPMVEAKGGTYHALPIRGPEDITAANAKALRALIDAAQGPILVHCGSGNRVGALLALDAALAGKTFEQSLEIGRAAGLTRLEPHVKTVLQQRVCAEAPAIECVGE